MQPFDRPLQRVQRTVVDHHVIGQRQALLAAGLGRHHRFCQRSVYAIAGHQPAQLDGHRRIHHEYAIQPRIGGAAAGLGQQRNVGDRIRPIGLFALLTQQSADGGVGDGL